MTESMRFEPQVDENASSDATAGCFRAIGIAMITGLLVIVATVAGIFAVVNYSPLSTLDYLPTDEAVGRIALAVIDDIGEEPSRPPAPPADVYPIESSVNEIYAGVLQDAFDVMRSTDEGAALFDQLLEHDVLVSVEDIGYNAGYTRTRWSWYGWVSSEIVIDSDSIRSRNLDSLAAILVHEAAHAQRAITGDACFFDETCVTLPNGVELTEEVAAHEVEARFWAELYGDDGKRFAFGSDSGENRLLERWLDGPEAFEAYVREIRGDDREGVGI
jgi:hypothetical protein